MTNQFSSTQLAAFLNGQWIPRSELSIDVGDHGFVYGATVSERLRTFGGHLFQISEHFDRLKESLEMLGLSPENWLAKLPDQARKIVAHNYSQLQTGSDLGLVVLVTPGTSNEDSGPTVLMYTTELPFEQMNQWYGDGVSLRVSSHRQVPSNCWPSRIKCRSRMHYYLADQEAIQQEPGARALLLDQNGFVAEASTANLLIYIEGQGLLSPRLDNILPGISLGVIQTLAENLKIPFEFGDFTVADLLRADEVLLCSTSPCVWSVRQCDGQSCGGGVAGQTLIRLQQAWSDYVGLDIVTQAADQAAEGC